jgi:hypothetical protein
MGLKHSQFERPFSNLTINSIIELKNLRFHTPEENKKTKCHIMHIGSNGKYCQGMKVHGVTVDSVSQAVYLGDVINQDGSNTGHIRDRVSKGMGQMNTVMNLLKTVSFGSKFFEIAVTLREAHLVNGMLSTTEILYGLRKREIDELEEVDKILIRNILNAPISSCIEGLYLELGLIPISIILKARRISYFHYLVNLDEKEMLYQFFEAQYKYPSKDDWTTQVVEDLKDFEIPEDFKFMRSKSKPAFSRMLKIKTKEFALAHLLSLKSQHSKMDNLVYSELKMQNYLKSEEIPVPEAQNLFKFRVGVAQFKENFGDRYDNKTCPLCSISLDTQVHSQQCVMVKQKITIEGSYSDIFRGKISPNISKTLFKISKMREDFI